MNHGSRLAGLGKPSKPAKRLRSIRYELTATMPAPDMVEVDLWKNGKWERTVASVDPADLEESDFDAQGRLLPSVVWDTIQTAKQYLLETRGIVPVVPSKEDVYDSDYTAIGTNPKVR